MLPVRFHRSLLTIGRLFQGKYFSSFTTHVSTPFTRSPQRDDKASSNHTHIYHVTKGAYDSRIRYGGYLSRRNCSRGLIKRRNSDGSGEGVFPYTVHLSPTPNLTGMIGPAVLVK